MDDAFSNEPWSVDLDRGKNGIIPNVKNLSIIFRNHWEWSDEDERGNPCVIFDSFKQRAMKTRPIPGDDKRLFEGYKPIGDADYLAGLIWAQRRVSPIATKQAVIDAMDHCMMCNEYNPLTDYLTRVYNEHKDEIADDYLDWIPRLYLGIEEDYEFATEAFKRWLISAVARAFDPGCKVDNLIVLEGEQGAGKSTLLLNLAGPDWFGDALPAMHTKDASDYLRGKWIVELAEMSSIKRSEVEEIKAFITRREEKFRPAYGRAEIIYPRSCVFAGTTNADTYLRDTTGNRRFWPLRVGKVNVDEIAEDRDRIWAAACKLYFKNESWQLSKQFRERAEAEQMARTFEDEWIGIISNLIETHSTLINQNEMSVADVGEAMNIDKEKLDKATQMRIADCMKESGLVRKMGRFNSGRQRGKTRWERINMIRSEEPKPKPEIKEDVPF